MEWFWNAVMLWLGWTFAPVIFVIGLMLLIGVVYVFFAAWLKIEDAIDSVKRKFRRGV
jgi:hypothetical protein